MIAALQKVSLIFIFSFFVVLGVRAWIEPDGSGSGGVEAPLVTNKTHQVKVGGGGPGDISVADIWVKAYRNVADAAPGFPYNRRYRGEFLSKILQPGGLENLSMVIRGSEAATSRGADLQEVTVFCEPNEVLFTCAGARDFSSGGLQDRCSEQDCGLIGVEPIDAAGRNPNEPDFAAPAVGCRTLVFKRNPGSVQPSVRAFCAQKVERRWPS